MKAGVSKKEGKAQAQAAAALAARVRTHERLLFVLNAANTSAAMFLPCWAVLSTKVCVCACACFDQVSIVSVCSMFWLLLQCVFI